jgi:type IV pilus assembly protein PilO
MDLSEINWDFHAAGTWPLQVKALVIFLVCCVVAGGGVYYFTMDQLTELEGFEAEEQRLVQDFETKQKKAANLNDYQAQFADIEKRLGDMMKEMPTKAEVANLLNEISQTAITSGLEPKLFKPEGEVQKEGGFYKELPYTIEMLGKYEELGLFVSGLASLPRIVTVHNIEITTADQKSAALKMKATVKTYTEAVSE